MQSPKRLKKICDLETSAYSILDIAVKLEVKRISVVKFKSVIVDMVKFKSSDPNSEKPLLLFFLLRQDKTIYTYIYLSEI